MQYNVVLLCTSILCLCIEICLMVCPNNLLKEATLGTWGTRDLFLVPGCFRSDASDRVFRAGNHRYKGPPKNRAKLRINHGTESVSWVLSVAGLVWSPWCKSRCSNYLKSLTFYMSSCGKGLKAKYNLPNTNQHLNVCDSVVF